MRWFLAVLFIPTFLQAGSLQLDFSPAGSASFYTTSSTGSTPPAATYYSIEFDKTSNHYAEGGNYANALSSISVAGFIKSPNTDDGFIISKLPDGDSAGWSLASSGGIPQVAFLSSGANYIINWPDAGTITDGDWHHVGFTMNAAKELDIYVDGSKLTAHYYNSGSYTLYSNTTNIVLAARGDHLGKKSCYMTDWRIYSRVLSGTDMANLAAQTEISTSGLEARWLFTDGSGSTVTDDSGNDRDLTLVNSPSWSSDVP